jgi:hypothetical protein
MALLLWGKRVWLLLLLWGKRVWLSLLLLWGVSCFMRSSIFPGEEQKAYADI